MSRTDKDAPAWVTATWWRPRHLNCPHDYATTCRDCDLPPDPIVRRPTWGRRRPPACEWEPVYGRRSWKYQPPHWYINHTWYAPQRQSARIDCLNAAKEYRGGGEVETEPTTAQHRYCAVWEWC